jgi:hypothetical protein
MITTKGLPVCKCVDCGKIIDTATGAGQPNPGDVAICIQCGHIAIFANDLSLHEPNDSEIHKIAGNKKVLRTQKILEKFHQWVKNTK